MAPAGSATRQGVPLTGVPILTVARPLGDGRIDNIIIDSSVHVAGGIIVLGAMVAAAGWLARLALAGQEVDRVGQGLIIAAQVALAGQALIGIKLLDQGQGIVQLYIHYLGGLLPLGLFLAAGWFRFPDPLRRTRVLAVLTSVGLASAVMAFTIGQAYANRYG